MKRATDPAAIKRFNWTIVELKDIYVRVDCPTQTSFNWTIVELKVGSKEGEHHLLSRFNWTIVELKANYAQPNFKFVAEF